ncbi:MAG: glycosyltransferase family 2 protein [Stigonema ocellatum SAG 48.90 = DSM 106950]|nr:glycosyltransferase family 2 protein [Stigonema ocellatum SAG 48.90 = DSM 106950]
MINEKQDSQLLSSQTELNYRHLQLLKTQEELEQASYYTHFQQVPHHNFLDQNGQLDPSKNGQALPVKMKYSDFSIDEKRLLLVSRLQAAQTCERMGKSPWTLKSNYQHDMCKKTCISVIITLFNYSEYIYECLDSVSKSNISDLPENIEILVIDDCSTDNSVNLVEEYFQKSNLPICLVKKWFNTGLADARNVGLKLARSPYVFILDADNWIYPNCLSVLYKTINSSPYAAVYGEIRRFDNQNKKEINRISCYDWDVYKLVKYPYIDAMAMFNKDIVLKVGGYSTELIEYGWFGWDDYDLWLKLAQLNYSCKLVPKVLSSYRVHSQSMINTTNKYALNIARYFCEKFAFFSKKNDVSDTLFGFPKSEIYLAQQSFFQGNKSDLEFQELEHAYAQIAAMKSSKFWKLRNYWFQLKKLLGLAKDMDIRI